MIARPPLIVPVLAFAGLAVLSLLVLGDWAPLASADQAVSAALRRYGDARPGLVSLLRVVTDLAATIPYLAVGVVGSLGLWRRGQRPAGVFCAVVTATIPALWGLAHWVLSRPRPVDGFVTVDGNGFPSGHTSNATAAGLVVVLLLWHRLTRTGRRVVVLLAAAFAVLIGVTRVLLLAHWPADVLGGWLLALGVVPLTAYLVLLERDRRRLRADRDNPPARGRHPASGGGRNPSS